VLVPSVGTVNGFGGTVLVPSVGWVRGGLGDSAFTVGWYGKWGLGGQCLYLRLVW